MNEELKQPFSANENATQTEPAPRADAEPTVTAPQTADPVSNMTVQLQTSAPNTAPAPIQNTETANTAATPTDAAPHAQSTPNPTQAAPYQPYTRPAYTAPASGGVQASTASQSTAYMGGSATWQSQTQTQTQTQTPATQKKKSGAGRVIAKVASVLALAILFGTVSGAVIMGMVAPNMEYRAEYGTDDGDTENAIPSQSTGDREVLSVTDAMKEAFEKAELAEQNKLTVSQINIIMEPAMVSIIAKGETYIQSFFGTSVYPTQSSGSGIIVGENDTEILIATNNHVVADSKEIIIQFVDGEEIAALIKGTDVKNDLAVVAVAKSDIPDATMAAIAFAALGDSDALVIGEGVVAVGNALGFGQSVTDGIVSALDRAVEDSDGNVSHMIQTNAAINPGNSGGALVNMQGQVIGINSAKYADEAVEGMGFAIPINTALPILEELMARITRTEVTDSEKMAYLGITPQDVSSAMRETYGWPVGVYVSEVTEGSCADKGGLLRNDIITKFDGETVTNTATLRKLLSYYEAGETVKITVERHERGTFETVVLEVTLDKKPAESNS